MRALLSLVLILPVPAFAAALDAESRITDVTVYPFGAEVTREVTVDAPAGLHDIVVDGLPEAALDSGALRIAPGEGVSVGAYALKADGVPLAKPRLTDAQQSARARVKALEAEERTLLGRIEAISARIDAAEAKAGFLRALGEGDVNLAGATAESLQTIADMIGAEVLAARQEAMAAKAELLEVEATLAELQADLNRARMANETVSASDAVQPSLTISVSKASDGPATLRVTYIIGAAAWQPVYDIALARREGRLTIDRGVLVSQDTGEDWNDVRLTLSTARLGDQSGPVTLWPALRRIAPEAAPDSEGTFGGAAPVTEPVMEPEIVMEEPGMSSALAGFVGDTVVYRYDPAVSVASGTESLRLALDRVDLAADVTALAVPRHDATAFLNATFTNTADEILLPGQAYLFRDGALVTTTEIDALAPGVETDLAFGPIEGLRLSRDMPLRAEGERGILTTSNQVEERAVLKVENRTAEAWPVRLLDQVPYSEQDDLEISYTASPPPAETDVDGQRGILAWEFELAPGATRDIVVEHAMSWPEGMVLQ